MNVMGCHLSRMRAAKETTLALKCTDVHLLCSAHFCKRFCFALFLPPAPHSGDEDGLMAGSYNNLLSYALTLEEGKQQGNRRGDSTGCRGGNPQSGFQNLVEGRMNRRTILKRKVQVNSPKARHHAAEEERTVALNKGGEEGEESVDRQGYQQALFAAHPV